MVLTAMLACLAFVLNTYVYFPSMAPFQHFVDVIAAVLLGPWYACAAAFLCGIMRMMSGRTIQAVVGAVFGPILGGLIYQKTHNIWLVLVGEVVGTGLLGAMTAYPLMKLFYGLDAHLMLGNVHSGERRVRKFTHGNIVNSDNGDVFRYFVPFFF